MAAKPCHNIPVPCSIPEGLELTGLHVNSNILMVLDLVGGEANPSCDSDLLSLTDLSNVLEYSKEQWSGVCIHLDTD